MCRIFVFLDVTVLFLSDVLIGYGAWSLLISSCSHNSFHGKLAMQLSLGVKVAVWLIVYMRV